MKAKCVLWLLVLLLAGCVENQLNDNRWSNEQNEDEYFVKCYWRDPINAERQSIDQYLLWIDRFYLGWEIYPHGWNQVTADLLAKIQEPDQVKQVADKMAYLGKTISAEWAKNNATRRINSQHISIWGNALLKSLEFGETLKIIDLVGHDVDDLLENRISAAMITENRFYSEEDIFKDLN